jgi:hypothetical protein
MIDKYSRRGVARQDKARTMAGRNIGHLTIKKVDYENNYIR